MDFRNYLNLARTLVKGSTEAEWRTAISRAYYTAFHLDCQLLRTLGFTPPRGNRVSDQVIQALDAALLEPTRTQITDTMKLYERDVLKDVTWHS
jgi:hypothetical protein